MEFHCFVWFSFWLTSMKENTAFKSLKSVHTHIYLFILIFESRIFMGSILLGVPHKMYSLFFVVLWFVLFNLQSLDRVYNKWFGGDNMTFYAFPQQSEHSANHSSSQTLFVLVISVSTLSHICSTSLSFLSTQKQNMKQWNDFAGILVYHCKQLLSSLHSCLIMWMPNKSLQFPFPEFFKILYLMYYIYVYIYIWLIIYIQYIYMYLYIYLCMCINIYLYMYSIYVYMYVHIYK